MAPKFLKSGASGTETKDGKTVCAKVRNGSARIEFTEKSIASGILYCDETSGERARLTSDVLNELGGKYKNRTHCFKENTQEKQAGVFEWMKEQCGNAKSIPDQAIEHQADQPVSNSGVADHAQGNSEKPDTGSLPKRKEVCTPVTVSDKDGKMVELKFYNAENPRLATVVCSDVEKEQTVEFVAGSKECADVLNSKHKQKLEDARRMCDPSYSPSNGITGAISSVLADLAKRTEIAYNSVGDVCPEIIGVGGSIQFTDKSLTSGSLLCEGDDPGKAIRITEEVLTKFGQKYHDKNGKKECIKSISDWSKHKLVFDWIEAECGLLYQIKTGHMDQVKEILAKDKFTVDKTALHHAVASRNVFIVRALLFYKEKRQEDISAQITEPFQDLEGQPPYPELRGKTPLMIAASNNDHQILASIFAKTPSEIPAQDLTKAVIAAVSTEPHAALEALELLLSRKATCQWSDVEKHLIIPEIKIEGESYQPESMDVPVLRLLLDNPGVIVGERSVSLDRARKALELFKLTTGRDGHCASLKSLISNFKDVLYVQNTRDKINGILATPLISAIAYDCTPDEIESLIGDNPPQVILRNALSIAAGIGRAGIVNLLIEKGVDLTGIDNDHLDSNGVKQLMRARVMEDFLQKKKFTLIAAMLAHYGTPPSSANLEENEKKFVDDRMKSIITIAGTNCYRTLLESLVGLDPTLSEYAAGIESRCGAPCKKQLLSNRKGFTWLNDGSSNKLAVYCFRQPMRVFTYLDHPTENGKTCSPMTKEEETRASQLCPDEKNEPGIPEALAYAVKHIQREQIKRILEFDISTDQLRPMIYEVLESETPQLLEVFVPYMDLETYQHVLVAAAERGFTDLLGVMMTWGIDNKYKLDPASVDEALIVAAKMGKRDTVQTVLALRPKLSTNGVFDNIWPRFSEKVLKKALDETPETQKTVIAELFKFYKESGFKMKSPSSDSGTEKTSSTNSREGKKKETTFAS
jgi:hypothetical protein